MKSFIILILVVGVVYCTEPPAPYGDHCIVGEQNLYDQSKSTDIPWFTINLDKQPKDRWTEVATAYKPQIVQLIGLVKNLTFPFFHGKLIQFVDRYLGAWDTRIQQPYSDEMLGIAEATGLPVGEIVMYNVFYEIFTVCTSIVAEDPQGRLYHARNLDFGLFMGWDPKKHKWSLSETLRPTTINLRWMKQGKEVYKSVNFAGFIGIYNGIKQNRFTITANERFDVDGGYVGILRWLLGLSPKANWMTWLTREVMEHADGYPQALNWLSTKPIMSPVYFIIGGNKTGQGAIITRSRDATVSTVTLDPSKPNGWYILQTNYDPGTPTLFLDDRRTPGNACMQKLGRSRVGFPGIFNVLSSKTNLNKLTTYTVLMQVATGRFETYKQDCPEPCWAF